MALFHNRVRVSTATVGTGNITLGLAQSGYTSPAEAGAANGDVLSYTIEDLSGANFEVGHGVYNSGTQALTRNVEFSKIAGQAAGTSPLSLSGSAKVFLTATAQDLQSLGQRFAVGRFGAKGDGSTPDSAAIQLAVNAAAASTKIKTVYLPDTSAGYVFNSTVLIPDGVTIIGDNKMGLELSRCKPAPGFTAPFFRTADYGVTRKLRIAITGLFLDGSSTTLTAVEVNCQESVFRDLTIKNCFTYGLHIGGVGSGLSQQALNNNITFCYMAGQIGVVEFFDALFLDNNTADTRVHGCYFEGSKDALIRSRAYNDVITGNHLFGSSASGGGQGVGYYSETSADKTFSSNYVENTAKAGVYIDGGASDVTTLNATISGNNFRNIDKGNTESGVIVIQGSNVSSVSVSGNVVRRDAATAYSTPYFVYFNGITPTLARVYGNVGASGLITTDETNIVILLKALSASDVNGVRVINAIAGSSPVVSAVGDDTNINLQLTAKGTGNVITAAGLRSSSPTAGIGYGTGAGGTVTQATSKSTGVTLNTVCGRITMNAASLGANTQTGFVVTNSACVSGDIVHVNVVAGAADTSAYDARSDSAAAGSFNIRLRNLSGGALAEAVVIGFVIIKAVTS